MVLVTGAARGIGQAIARVFCERGDQVVVTDLDAEGARKCARDLGDGACALGMDVCEEARVGAVVDEVWARFGRIDVLVNNAGRMTQGPASATDAEAFRRMVDVNVTGIFHCVQAVAPRMSARGQGAIVNIASVSSVRGGGAVGNVWYGATKAAVVAMTAGLAREFGPSGVRVNAVSPGLVETGMVAAFLTPEVRERVMPRFPLGRLCTVDDVARAVLFLASDAAAFVSGQTLAVDGAFLAS